MPRVDFRFDLGSFVALFIALVAGAAAYGSIRSDLEWLKTETSEVRKIADRLTRVEQELHDRPPERVRAIAEPR